MRERERGGGGVREKTGIRSSFDKCICILIVSTLLSLRRSADKSALLLLVVYYQSSETWSKGVGGGGVTFA